MKLFPVLTLISTVFLLTACGGEQNGNTPSQKASTQEQGLSDFEMENGIGPVTETISITEIDPDLAKKGGEVFELKCSACHKMNERYVGPALGDVAETRTPAYLMNMILNPDGMVKKHPEAKKMLQQFMTPMPNQGLDREEARAIVEYLSAQTKN